MVASADSIALFSLSLAGLHAADVSSPKVLTSIKAASAIVLALVAYDPERVHYCTQVTSVATGALLYAQLPSIMARLKPRKHHCRHRERTHSKSHLRRPKCQDPIKRD